MVVQDQLFREHGLVNKLRGIGKIANVLRTVTVAGEKQWQIIFSTATKDLETVFSCVTTIAIRRKRSFVDLEDGSGFFCSSGKNFIIYRIVCVIAVPRILTQGFFITLTKASVFSSLVPGR